MNLFDYQFLSSSRNHKIKKPEYDCFDVDEEQSDSKNDTSTSCCFRETTSPSCSLEKSLEKKPPTQVFKGPDVFGKVLGPTADESILVGLQALMDMAGTLEFTSRTPSRQDNQLIDSISSKDTSEAFTQNTTSCQHYCINKQDKSVLNSLEEVYPQVVNEIGRKPCQYIITQENISSINQKKKCQHSQTRVLPTSMTCYNPDHGKPCENCNSNLITCPNVVHPINKVNQSQNPCKLKKQRNPSPVPKTGNTQGNCPCSKFYQQLTTISVLENTPEDQTCTTCPPCPPNKKNFSSVKPCQSACCDVNLDYEPVGCSIQKQTREITIQTITPPCPILCDAILETDSIATQNRSSVACNCSLCIPVSAGVSKPSSRISNNVSRMCSVVRFSDDERPPPSRRYYNDCENRRRDKSDFTLTRNKSCACYLIPKGIRVADVACSCLKVNTSCQYYRSEFSPTESRSTQCDKSSQRHISTTQICSESGDYQPLRKKSVRVIGGPFDCPDFSETRYSIESPVRIISRTGIQSLEYNDELSKIGMEKSIKLGSFEMGDSCLPPMEIRYAITKITKFRDFSTFEVMKSTSKKPKCMPKSVEGVFVLKKDENCN